MAACGWSRRGSPGADGRQGGGEEGFGAHNAKDAGFDAVGRR